MARLSIIENEEIIKFKEESLAQKKHELSVAIIAWAKEIERMSDDLYFHEMMHEKAIRDGKVEYDVNERSHK